MCGVVCVFIDALLDAISTTISMQFVFADVQVFKIKYACSANGCLGASAGVFNVALSGIFVGSASRWWLSLELGASYTDVA